MSSLLVVWYGGNPGSDDCNRVDFLDRTTATKINHGAAYSDFNGITGLLESLMNGPESNRFLLEGKRISLTKASTKIVEFLLRRSTVELN
ncbi:hypothetical protein R1flu_012612 [Riccia fluitans]|uniref:Uncharacterized protein n=1 Tax=Riccia fluitans TaxID=41844 RepID=A0ABD1ZB99_9MARC